MRGSDSHLPLLRGLTPETRCLLVFVPIAALALNLLLPHLPGQPRQVMTSLDYTLAWFRGIAHEDSWKPMRMALEWLEEPRDEGLYQEIFFDRGVKLQYPPTSMLWMDVLAALPGGNWTSNNALNGLSWLAVLLTVAMSTWLLDRLARAPPRSLDRGLRVVLAIAAGVTFYPLVRGFYLGQVQTWIDALVAALVLAWVAGRPATSGALAGLVCLIKPQLGLLFLWALLRRHHRFAAGWALVAGGFGLLSLVLYGFANHLDYLQVLASIGRHGESFNPNQSVNGLVHRLLGNGNNRQWVDAFPPFDVRVYVATLVSSALLIGAALFWRRREARVVPARVSPTTLDLAIMIASVTMASPVAWTHHYGVFLPLFALALPACLAATEGRRGLVAMLALSFLLVSNTYRIANRLADSPFNFLQSYVFFGGLLFLALLYRLRATTGRAS
jgi:hypothetical protein